MNSDDTLWTVFRAVAQAFFFIWLMSRNGSEDRRSRGHQRMTDGRMLARTVGGWGRQVRRNHEPAPTPSPRSHPLWDRELDG